MTNITEQFADIYQPFKGIVVHTHKAANDESCHVESFDFSSHRKPINFHPLTENECSLLLQTLTASGNSKPFLHLDGLLPLNLLHLTLLGRSQAIWYTPVQKCPLLFVDELEIPSGLAYVPPLIWKASRTQLYLYAVATNERPDPDTPLYHAPFFNVRESGLVCMGTVHINISESCSLQEFLLTWQGNFFNSTFTYLLNPHPCSTNIIQLWQKQIQKQRKFPLRTLVPNRQTLKHIL